MGKTIGAKKFLAVGSGSIGRRHLQNLASLGSTRLAVCDTDASRMQPVIDELGAASYGDYEQALQEFEPDVVFVCTPPSMHLAQAARAVAAGADVFIEKPLSHRMESTDELIRDAATAGRVVQVGYNLRFHPGLKIVKQMLERGEIGKVLWAYVEFGQYLPDWRPWHDYRASYTARKELGGGIVLDCTHELDYILWMMGQPEELTAMSAKASSLDMDVEDTATVLIRFTGGAEATVHMDCIQRDYSRLCRLVGEGGTIEWKYKDSCVRVYRPDSKQWDEISYEFEPNQMYLDELKDFIEKVRARETDSRSLEESRLALKVGIATLESSQARQWVSLKD